MPLLAVFCQCHNSFLYFQACNLRAEKSKKVTPRAVWIRKAKILREGKRHFWEEGWRIIKISSGGRLFSCSCCWLIIWLVIITVSIIPLQWRYHIIPTWFCVYIFQTIETYLHGQKLSIYCALVRWCKQKAEGKVTNSFPRL